MVSYRRIFDTTAKKVALVGVPLVFAIFFLLAQKGDITITGYSGDMKCAGTVKDPCYAYLNFTANADIYIYPSSDWSKAINESGFLTDKPMKEIIMQRSWGTGWRTIDLNSTWSKDVKYAIKFSNEQNYSIRFIGYKVNPTDTVKWGFFNVDPIWDAYTKDDFFTKLIDSKSDITGGYAIFKLTNPTNVDLPINLNFYFDYNNAPIVTNDITILKATNHADNVTDYKTICEDIPFDNKTNEGPTCVDIESGWHWNNYTTEAYVTLLKNDVLKSKDTAIIKITSSWKAKLGDVNIDWVPKITLSKDVIGTKNDISLSKKEWAWWNSSFGYRKLINITNMNSTTILEKNYTYNFTLDTATLISGGKLQSNCNDLRIVDSDTTNLDLDVYNCNSATTTILFRSNYNISAGGWNDTNYYLYYGYATAEKYLNDLRKVYYFYENMSTFANYTTDWGFYTNAVGAGKSNDVHANQQGGFFVINYTSSTDTNVWTNSFYRDTTYATAANGSPIRYDLWLSVYVLPKWTGSGRCHDVGASLVGGNGDTGYEGGLGETCNRIGVHEALLGFTADNTAGANYTNNTWYRTEFMQYFGGGNLSYPFYKELTYNGTGYNTTAISNLWYNDTSFNYLQYGMKFVGFNLAADTPWVNATFDNFTARLSLNSMPNLALGTEEAASSPTSPTYSNFGTTVTNNTGVNTGAAITYYAQWTDDKQLSNCTNSSVINSTTWANSTWSVAGAANWTNYTISYPSSAAGGNYTVKIYCNDSDNNMSVTGPLYWYNTTAGAAPPVAGSNFYIDGGIVDKIMEFGDVAVLNMSNAVASITNISIGKNILNSSASILSLTHNFSVKPYWTKFNNTLTNQNATKIGTKYIISFANMSRNNSFISCKANMTGYIDAGSYAKNILIDTANDGFVDNYLMGELQENQKLYVDSLNTGDKSINVTFTAAGSATKYFNISSFNTTNVTFNISGYTEPAYTWVNPPDDYNYTCSNYGWCAVPENGGNGDWGDYAYVWSNFYGNIYTMTITQMFNLPTTDTSKILNLSTGTKFGYDLNGGSSGTVTVSIWDYSGGSWVTLFSNTTTSSGSLVTLTNTTNRTVGAGNYISSGLPVLLKSYMTITGGSGGYPNGYTFLYENAINFNISASSVDNVTIDAGNDGTLDWEWYANMNGSTPQKLSANFSEAFNTYISAKCSDKKSCKVPITIVTGSGGKLNISSIKINSTITGIDLNVTAINRQLSTTTSNVTFNITNNTRGIVNMKDLYCPYYGNGVVNLTGCNSTTCINRNITVYYSNFLKTLPYTFTNSVLWYPTSNSSQNVTPYGQSASTPIYNITTKAWEKNMTLGLRFQLPNGNCLNFTWSTSSTKNTSSTINATNSNYQVIRSNMNMTNQNIGLWFWIDLFNCNSSQTHYYTPNITLKGCCVSCTCW